MEKEIGKLILKCTICALAYSIVKTQIAIKYREKQLKKENFI